MRDSDESSVSVTPVISVQTSWLRSFLAVADRGGFGAATASLHLSQSRVSAHIAALENAVGVTLFDRKARPTRPTPAGELFREHALAAIQELRRGAEAARSTLDHVVGHARIGSYPGLSSTFLPSVLRELQNRHPDITVELVEGTSAALEEMLVEGAVDIAFRPELPRVQDPTLRFRSLWREDIVAVMRADDDLASVDTVDVQDLSARTLIGNPADAGDDGGGFGLLRSLGDGTSGTEVAYVTDQPAMLVALVRSRFGVGLINRLALDSMNTAGLEVRPVSSPTAVRKIAVFWKNQRSGVAVVKALLEAQSTSSLPLGVLPPA